jgi:hypothetical protein
MLSCASSASNPKVQVEAIEGGALQKLLVILATEQPLTVKKKVSFCPFLLPNTQHTLWGLKGKVPFPHMLSLGS